MNKSYQFIKNKITLTYNLLAVSYPLLFPFFATVILLGGGILIATYVNSSERRNYEYILEISNEGALAKITKIENMTYINMSATGNYTGVNGLKISYSFNYNGNPYLNKEIFKFGVINSVFELKIKKMKEGDFCTVYFSSNNPNMNTIYSN